MGTRGTTHIYDGIISTENHLVSIYIQFDTYISGYGKKLSKFLNSIKLTNGYTQSQEHGGYANGMGCLAAQLIGNFKKGVGGFYITNKSDSQEYDYHIYYTDTLEMYIKVIRHDNEIFDGTLFEFTQFVEKEEE